MKETCIFCGNETKDIYGLSSYIYCPSCKIARLKNLPKASYEETYYKGKSSLAGKLFYPFGRLFYAIRNTYARKGKKTLWIDVGAGEGNYLKTVRASKKIGVEISEAGRRIMDENGIQTLTPNQFLKSKNLKASVISFWHVLEHVDNPEEYIKAAQKNISTKGKVIVGIPNMESWEFRIFKKYWFHLAPKYHIWHFAPVGMINLLEKEGFKIEIIDWWSPEHHLAGLIQSLINFTSKTEDVLHKLVKRELSNEKLPLKGLLVSLFWLTLGLPFIFIWWILASLTHQSGTLVLVASPKR